MVRVVGTRPGGIPEAWGQAGVNLECCQARDRWGCPWVDREMESGYPGVPQVRCTPALAPSTRKRGILLGWGMLEESLGGLHGEVVSGSLCRREPACRGGAGLGLDQLCLMGH